jgi:shikimate kinase
MAPKLILTGFMATGKSAVARAIARRLRWRLIDCDERLVAQAGQPISEIFRAHGEAHFRALESAMIQSLAADERRCPQCTNPLPAVIATGGGALVDARNFDALSRIGVIICLAARPEVIARRAGPHAASRPMLAVGGKPLNERIAELIAARREAYARAPITLDTSDFSIEQAATAAIAAFTAHAKSWSASAGGKADSRNV